MYLCIIHQRTEERRDFKTKLDLDYWIDCHRSLNAHNANLWYIYRTRSTGFPFCKRLPDSHLCTLWEYMSNNFKFKNHGKKEKTPVSVVPCGNRID